MTSVDISKEISRVRNLDQEELTVWPGQEALLALSDLVERARVALLEVENQRRRNGVADDRALAVLDDAERALFSAVPR